MEILSSLLLVCVTLAIPAWHIWLSPMARSTNELAKLNKLTKPFAEKKKRPEALLSELQSRRWKYHREKAQLFVEVCKAMI